MRARSVQATWSVASVYHARNDLIERSKTTMLKTLATLLALSVAAHASEQPGRAKFLWISDLHFNPMADPMLVEDLEAADAMQWEAILERTQPASYSVYGSDTNWWLLKSALQQFPVTLLHPAFIMVTGDLLAHNFPDMFRSITHDTNPEHYRLFVRKTVQFLALQMRRKFPSTKIFVTPGNNDNDCGNYSVQAGGAFLNDTALIVRDLAAGDEQLVSSWKALGSFNVPHPTVPDVRIIAFNSVFFSQKYRVLSSDHGCEAVPSTAADDLFRWLSDNLEAAKNSHQQVWLMFHIPPGIDGYSTAQQNDALIEKGAPDDAETCEKSITPMWMWNKDKDIDWTKKFDALLENYSSTVLAGFAAHIHSDDFRLIGPAGAGQQFVMLNPAISPVYGQNPGFRVVSYKSNGTITDQATYYLTNLTCASSKAKGRWKKEYGFTSKWKAQELDAASLSRVYNQVVTDPKAREQWLENYAVLGPTLQEEKRFVRALYCADEGLSVEDYKACYCGAQVSH